MKQRSILWQAAGFAFATFAGTLLHFLYDWTSGSALVSPFSGVNESTWEHMKLLFWPLFLFALVQRLFFQKQQNYWCVKLLSTCLGLALIPVLFYTYNGAFGHSPDWLNIAIFYLCAACVFLLEWWLLPKELPRCLPALAFTLLCLIGILFVVFTASPPELPLFRDPLTGNYGL